MSVRVVAQVALREGCSDAERTRVARGLVEGARAQAGTLQTHAAPHLALSVGGGDLTWDWLIEDEATLAAHCDRLDDVDHAGALKALGPAFGDVVDAVARVEFAVPAVLAAGHRSPGLVGIKRTLWLEVKSETSPAAVAEFEREMPLLAACVPAIRNYRFSRIRRVATPLGTTRFSHLWEQEFESAQGLEIDYMSSPAHWGWIDRWFDIESPDAIVDSRLAHLACLESQPVLSWPRLDTPDHEEKA